MSVARQRENGFPRRRTAPPRNDTEDLQNTHVIVRAHRARGAPFFRKHSKQKLPSVGSQAAGGQIHVRRNDMKRITAMLLTLVLLVTMLPQMTLFASAESYKGEYGNKIVASAEYVAPQSAEGNTFDVTWLDVVYAYPSYLNNNDAAIQEAAVLQLCQDIFDDYSGWDTFWSSLEYSLKNAGNIKTLITSIANI